ncbi:tape measure protein [Methylolobus aquaticus]
MNKLFSIETIFSATDRMTPGLRRITDTVDQFREKTALARTAGQLFDRGVRDAYRPLGSLGRLFESAHRSNSLFVGGLRASWSVLSGTAAQLTALGGAVAGAYGVQRLVRSVIGTGAQFEGYQAQLETTLGSVDKAQSALQWIQQFAKTTPYEVAGVTEAFVRLKAYGIDPMDGTLRSLGDAAAGLHKPMMAAVEAIADAVMGENERLKEFGIKASVDTKHHLVTYRWLDKAGKEREKTIDSSNQRLIASTLQTIWNEKYAGGMDRLSRTWEGIVSNLSDTWTGFLRQIGDAGAFAAAGRAASRLLASFARFTESRAGVSVARQISGYMESAIGATERFVERLAGGDVRGAMAVVGDALRAVADQVQRLIPRQARDEISEWWSDLRAVTRGASGAVEMLSSAWGNVVSALDAITGGRGRETLGWLATMEVTSRAITGVGLAGWVRGVASAVGLLAAASAPLAGWGVVLAAVAAAGLTIYQNWDPLKRWFREFFDGQVSGLKGMRDDLTGAWDDLRKKISTAIDGVESRVVAFVEGIRSAVASVRSGLGSVLDYMNNSDGAEFGVPRALKQSFVVSPSAPPGYADFISRMAGEFGVRDELMRTIFARESSSGKDAGFNGWDSNARKGTPSYGPFQFIEPTFNRLYKEAMRDRSDLLQRLGPRDWKNWHQQAAVASWAFAHGKSSHWSTYRGEPINAPREYRIGRAAERSVRVENEITIIQDDQRQRVLTKTRGDGAARTRVNVGKNRFGLSPVRGTA